MGIKWYSSFVGSLEDYNHDYCLPIGCFCINCYFINLTD
ncbi:hypothetical protein AMTRI_Chr02g219540 [Amborella trichopoda]